MFISFSIYPELAHNKHFIRHNIPQNKVLIIPKSPSFLPRQTIFDTKRPIPHPLIRILRLLSDRLRSLPQIRLHLLPICNCLVRTNRIIFSHKRQDCRKYDIPTAFSIYFSLLLTVIYFCFLLFGLSDCVILSSPF